MFIASAADSGPIWWIAILASSLQGVHILFSFGLNENTRRMWKTHFQRHPKAITNTTLTK